MFLATIAFVVLFPNVVLWLPKMLLPESVGSYALSVNDHEILLETGRTWDDIVTLKERGTVL